MATIRGQREKYFVKRLKQLLMYLSGQKGHCHEVSIVARELIVVCRLTLVKPFFFFFAVVKTKVIIEGVSILKPF